MSDSKLIQEWLKYSHNDLISALFGSGIVKFGIPAGYGGVLALTPPF
jgi:hypothetical protein